MNALSTNEDSTAAVSTFASPATTALAPGDSASGASTGSSGQRRGRKLALTSAVMPMLGGQPALEPIAVDGEEMLSRTFAYTLTLRTPERAGTDSHAAANVAIKQLVGHELTTHVLLDGRPGAGRSERHLSGIVTRARFLRLENRRALYQAVVEPWLCLARRSSDYRIYQNVDVLDIVRQVLGKYGQPFELRATQSYPVREFVVQYGETDLDFIERQLHTWGLYYYFEHGESSHRMVITDDMATHKAFPIAGYQRIPFHADDGSTNEEHCDRFQVCDGLQSGQWVTSDFDFTRPKAQLQQTEAMPRKTGNNQLERYIWPGNYTDEAQGQQLARRRMEEAGSDGDRASGAGNLRAVVPGCTITLSGHPQDSANREHLVTGARLHLQENGDATNQEAFECRAEFDTMPTDKIFRAPAPQLAPPRTTGPQTAIVTGPAGREIWTDQYGRVKLSFHWNRYCTKDENSSCWVRVSSPWAGTNFGGIQIPRVGQEVVVDFEYGDPDRPLVTGRVYNADNMPPWDLPANATQSGLLTRSSEGATADNANALRFEDKKGQEQLWLHAEKDQLIEVEHDEVHTVGNNRTKTVDNDETNHIKNNRTETVDANETITVHGQRTETVDGNETVTIQSNKTHAITGTESVTVTGNQTHTAQANRTASVTGNQATSVAGTDSLSVTGARSVNAQNVDTWTVALAQTTSIGQAYSLSTLSTTESVGTTKTVTTGGNHSVTAAGGNVSHTASASISQTAQGGNITHDASQNFDASAGQNIGLTAEGGTFTGYSAGNMALTSGASIKHTVGGSTVHILGNEIVLAAGGSTLVINAAGVKVNGTMIWLNC